MANILCVDDEPHVANLRCRILGAAGHRTTPAWSVSEAISRLKQARYEVVITGWRLCDGSGESIVSAAKALAPAPLVVVSGYIDEEPGTQQLADLYLRKMIDPDELAGVVRKLLRRASKTGSKTLDICTEGSPS